METKTTVGATAPLPDNIRITVCSACLQASCWRGVLMCENSRNAGTETLSVGVLRRLKYERSDYWEHDPNAVAWRKQQAAGAKQGAA